MKLFVDTDLGADISVQCTRPDLLRVAREEADWPQLASDILRARRNGSSWCVANLVSLPQMRS